MTDSCKQPAKELKKRRADEPFQPVDPKKWEAEKMQKKMKAMGMKGQLYDREEMQRMAGNSPEEEQEGQEEEEAHHGGGGHKSEDKKRRAPPLPAARRTARRCLSAITADKARASDLGPRPRARSWAIQARRSAWGTASRAAVPSAAPRCRARKSM